MLQADPFFFLFYMNYEIYKFSKKNNLGDFPLYFLCQQQEIIYNILTIYFKMFGIIILYL